MIHARNENWSDLRRLRELQWNLLAGQQRRQEQRQRLLRLLEGRVRAKLKKLQGKLRVPR